MFVKLFLYLLYFNHIPCFFYFRNRLLQVFSIVFFNGLLFLFHFRLWLTRGQFVLYTRANWSENVSYVKLTFSLCIIVIKFVSFTLFIKTELFFTILPLLLVLYEYWVIWYINWQICEFVANNYDLSKLLSGLSFWLVDRCMYISMFIKIPIMM